MAETKPNPSTKSGAYGRMEAAWCRIDHILAGPDCIRAQGERYLPKYEAEDAVEYARRLKAAPWRPEFDDALRTLAAKPFGKDVALGAGASAQMKTLAEDIDGCGNNLTAFSRGVFRGGIAKGLHAILVEYPTMAPGATLADERRAGARPYWVSIKAGDILALYTAFQAGKEIVTHVRVIENETVQVGFDEVTICRVRVFDRAALTDDKNRITGYGPPTWQVWEANEDGEFALTDEGTLSLSGIPLALFWTGEREGCHYVKPPLNDLADMQIELYRALSRHEETLTYAGSPMLQGAGIQAPGPNDPAFAVGPKRVLFAPPGVEGTTTGWSYVSPDAATITAGAAHIDKIQTDMRRLGMQPMTQQSGTVTATATSTESAKAHSTLQAWALGLKDVLEQAFMFTAEWLGQADGPEVEVSTDFSVVPFAQAPLTALAGARASGDIDHETYLNGLRRFDVLPPDADVQKIMQAAVDEGPADPTEEEIAAALGQGPVPARGPASPVAKAA